jgi:small ligand-binding sensory domain FIST
LKFRVGHATHHQWQMACELALSQVEGLKQQIGFTPNSTLGFVYLTESLAAHGSEVLELLKERTGVDDWVGAVGMGICATGAEYFNEPAVSIMLTDLPVNQYQIFSGRRRAPKLDERTSTGEQLSYTAVVHADPATGDIQELINDMADRTQTGLLFGGITSGQASIGQFAAEPVNGGISGAVFSSGIKVLTKITQGCSPLGKEHSVASAQGHYLRSFDSGPALDVLLKDLGIQEQQRTSRNGEEILKSISASRLQKGLLIGVSPKSENKSNSFGFGDYVVRHIVGIDPINRIVAVADHIHEGDKAVFCTRDAQAARKDLIRICTELRSEAEEEGLEIQGALYFSCVARGENTFGEQGAELGIIQHNLGDVPLTGFYANGEIGRNKLYGYTGVLTLFVK